MNGCEEGCCLIAEARGPLYQCEGRCAYKETTVRDLIASDSYAMTFQSLGQYRTALLKFIDREAR